MPWQEPNILSITRSPAHPQEQQWLLRRRAPRGSGYGCAARLYCKMLPNPCRRAAPRPAWRSYLDLALLLPAARVVALHPVLQLLLQSVTVGRPGSGWGPPMASGHCEQRDGGRLQHPGATRSSTACGSQLGGGAVQHCGRDQSVTAGLGAPERDARRSVRVMIGAVWAPRLGAIKNSFLTVSPA
jgi:hypothetical protein